MGAAVPIGGLHLPRKPPGFPQAFAAVEAGQSPSGVPAKPFWGLGMNAATGLAPGTVLAQRYEILREIGRGERSIVFEAHDSEREERVSVKLLSPPAAIAHLAREQLRRDSDALRAVDHPGIRKPRDLIEAGFATLIVADWIEGVDLTSRVSMRGPLGPHEAGRIGRGIAEALAASHAHGLLHRDVKPQNILLPDSGGTVLTDFGCAPVDGQEATLEEDSSARHGGFFSPAVAEGRYADARSDIYALGMSLYYALVGALPEQAGPLGPPAPRAEGFHPARVRPDVPKWLDEIVARATCAEPAARIETAERLARALDEEGLPAGVEASREAYLVDCCILCREPGTLGRSVCPHCEDSKASESDTLIMLVPPTPQDPGREERVRRLRGLTGAPSDERSVRRVANGKQPLVKLSRSQAQRVALRLGSQGFETRLVAADATWAELPDWLRPLALVPIGLGCRREPSGARSRSARCRGDVGDPGRRGAQAAGRDPAARARRVAAAGELPERRGGGRGVGRRVPVEL